MSEPTKNTKLIQTKLALAEKYERLAALSGSQPKTKRMLHHAARFRRQAADLARQG
jgi:hypothetical protein